MATNNVDIEQDPNKLLGQLMKAKKNLLSPWQKGVNKKLEEMGSAQTEEAIQGGMHPEEIAQKAGLDNYETTASIGSSLSPEEQKKQDPNGVISKLLNFLPAKGIMSPAQVTKEGIQQGGALSWIGGNSTGDLLKRMLVASQIQERFQKGSQGNLSADQMFATLQPYQEKLDPLGMQAYLTPEGKIGVTNQPSSMNDINVGRKEEQWKAKSLVDMGNDLDPAKSVRNALGVGKLGITRTERLEGLVNQYPDMNLDKREIEELAIGLNSVLQGSNVSAQEQVAQLVPQSVIGNAQKLYEWISNEPKGLKQQEFVKRMVRDVRREKQVMTNQVYDMLVSKVPKYRVLQDKYPEEWSDILRGQGINPDKYKEWKKNGFKKNDVTSLFDISDRENNVEAGQESLLPPDRANRLQELRKKQAAGTLGR